jgi:hypothetical protein
MLVYALIIEAHSDDDRLIGLYSSLEAAQEAYDEWYDGHYPFYRVEARLLDGEAYEYSPMSVVYEHQPAEDEEVL